MQYIGPIFMGIGMFLLIIACVITLESRDRHAQAKFFNYLKNLYYLNLLTIFIIIKIQVKNLNIITFVILDYSR